jgi:hypothetical protein
MFKKIKQRLSFFSIVIIFISVVWVQFNHKLWENPKSVIQWDVINYYQFLPATFDYGDLSLKFIDKDLDLLKWKFWPHKSPTGMYTDKMSMGLSFMYLPFYLIAELYSRITHQPTDGFSPAYAFCLVFSALFYVIIGLVFLRKTLLRYFNDTVVALTLLSIFFGTNLLYYTTLNAPMSHAYLFLLFAVFIYYTLQWYEKINYKHSIIIGLLLGLISLIRPTNLLISLFFIFYAVTSWTAFTDRLKLFLMNWRYLLLICLLIFIVWIPQLIYWKYTTGSYLYFSYQNERFFFDNPQLFKGLFGFRKGWFIYTPLMLFAVLSILLFLKKYREFFLPVFLFTALNIYLILSWWCWWYGGTYGHRAFVESYAILSIPLALLLSFGLKKNLFAKILTVTFVLIMISHQIFQTIQYNYKSIHYDAMSRAAYWDSFLNVRPSSKFESLLIYPDYEKAVIDNDQDSKLAIISSKLIMLKASNAKFVSVDLENNGLLFANKDKALGLETFNLIQINDGSFGLLSFDNKYVSAEVENKNEIIAVRTKMNEWESFSLEKLDEKYVAIKAINGNYLSVDNNSEQLFANAKTIGKNEKFELIYK